MLAQLQPSLADQITRLARDRVQAAVDRALGNATSELRAAIDARVREVVDEAIAAEIAKRR